MGETVRKLKDECIELYKRVNELLEDRDRLMDRNSELESERDAARAEVAELRKRLECPKVEWKGDYGSINGINILELLCRDKFTGKQSVPDAPNHEWWCH